MTNNSKCCGIMLRDIILFMTFLELIPATFAWYLVWQQRKDEEKFSKENIANNIHMWYVFLIPTLIVLLSSVSGTFAACRIGKKKDICRPIFCMLSFVVTIILIIAGAVILCSKIEIIIADDEHALTFKWIAWASACALFIIMKIYISFNIYKLISNTNSTITQRPPSIISSTNSALTDRSPGKSDVVKASLAAKECKTTASDNTKIEPTTKYPISVITQGKDDKDLLSIEDRKLHLSGELFAEGAQRVNPTLTPTLFKQ
eukprot:423762_1